MTRKIQQVIVAALAAVMLLSMTPLMPGVETVHAGTQTPTKVTGVKASVSKTKVTVKWKKAKRATKYKVLVQVKSGKKWKGYTEIGTNKTSYTFKGNAGTNYRIRVRGATADDAGPWSGWKTVKTKGTSKTDKKPVPVKNIKVKENKRGLTVSWDKPNTYGARITGYTVTARLKYGKKEMEYRLGTKYKKVDEISVRPEKTSATICRHSDMESKDLNGNMRVYQVKVVYEFEYPKNGIEGQKTSDWKNFNIKKDWSKHDLKLIKQVDATWDEKGYKQYKCSICGHKEKEEVCYVITEKDVPRIYKNLIAMKEKYPEGTRWGANERWCGGYASRIREEILPKSHGECRVHHNLNRLYPGDRIIWGDEETGHTLVYIEPVEGGFLYTDGNNHTFNDSYGHVHWGAMAFEALKCYQDVRVCTDYQPFPKE